MTTGTEGNDNLTNDRTLKFETIDALGGDDVITVLRPNTSFNSTFETVTVNGGSGFDTLIVDTGYSNFYPISNSGFDGSFTVRSGSSNSWTVSWTSIERLELTAKFFGNNNSFILGDEIDIIRLNLGLAGGSISTGAGNDEIYVDGGGAVAFSADAGSGNDIIDMSGATNSTFHRYIAAGGTGDDVITGSDYNDRLDGGSGDDVITGNGSFFALPNDGDEFVGGEGNDILTGGSTGTDWVRYDQETGGGAVYVNLSDSQTTVGGVLLDPSTARDTFGNTDALVGIEKVSGASGDDHMLGGSGVDKFLGEAGNDVLTGAGGFDELTGGAGVDTLDGGADTLDWVVYARESGTGSVAVNLSAAAATVGGVLLASNTARDTFGTIDTLIGIEQVRGAFGNDFFLGSSGNDRFEGSGGNDTIEGGAGNDSLIGDEGDDYLDGGIGADVLRGGTGNDVYVLDDASDNIFDDAGTDEVRTSLASYQLNSIENLTGTSDSGQTLAGSDGDNIIRAGGGGDLLVGNGGSDQLAGGAGNDTLYGGTQEGTDTSDDWAAYDLETGGGGVLVNLSGATQNLFGTAVAAGTARDTFGSIDTLVGIEFAKGNSGNDWFVGSAGVNRFEGGAGNDTLDGGGGADVLIGGTGDDSYWVENAGDSVTENAGEGTDEIRTSLLTYSLLSRPNVENLTATTDAAHDFRGNGGNNVISAGAGNDVLRLYDGGDDTVIGREGDDNIFFGGSLTAADVVNGGAGGDTLVLQGPYGALTLTANITQIENISLLAGSNTNFGEPGTNLYDYVLTIDDANFAAGVQARINGAALLAGEDFTFDGSAETNANLVVYGGKGVDTLTGGLGNDIFFYAEERFATGDTVNGGAGYDGMFLRGNYTIDFNAPGYTGLFTNIENLTLTSATDERYARGGGTEFDYNLILSDAIVKPGETLTVSGALLMATETMVLDASQELDGLLRLFGGRADDTLKGGANADLIHGNLGADSLTGNGGADSFRYQSVEESNSVTMDQILDFTPGTDSIDLSRVDANSVAAGDQAFSWIGSSAFSGSSGELRAYEQSGTWFVEGDVNGDSVADLVIALTLQGPTPLGVGDFIL
ncbi:MAG TPA: M10 family metallopeptidase C-terminal domain-containing protein [Allosphingosinicella sp.]|nr:M10 family metallopeptidase C-terminal domain-containing protein [Allosphingosinicella sp.]